MPIPNAKCFIRERGIALALIVVVMHLIALTQGAISYTMIFGQLKGRLSPDLDLLAAAQYTLRSVLLLLMIALWLFKRKRALMRVIVVANSLFTLVLLANTGFLMALLAGLSSRAVDALVADVVLMAMSNILIFSIWYWIIDPPGLIEDESDARPWAFLFPQRGSTLPHYESWIPRYGDYLFIAFTTSFAFSPTDAAPLTQTAKMLMLIQSAISVVTLTGIASSAINILAGAG
jgi:hypothetical protein